MHELIEKQEPKEEKPMKIIKRNGAEVVFDIDKIIMAVTKANDAVDEKVRMTPLQIERISQSVQIACEEMGRSPSVEEIQDLVEKAIMAHGAFEVAKEYITYRYTRSLLRQSNTTDDRILSLIECNNEEVKQENANKNPTINAVQRDYMAGEVSKDITSRILLPKEVVDAHEAGIIHFHDADYYAQHMHNCDLVNLEDMLQNGTVISGTLIEKPHSFSTACNIATQIIAQVASNQYGGQSISLTHLAPFVDVSRKKIAAEVEAEMEGLDVSAERKREIVERRLRNEINRGVQTIQYQVVTLMTTNGQAPFITVFMYLGEARNAQEKADLAIIIEETIRQRYQGVKNEAGVWITPAFPKLIYVLEEDNIHPGDPYYYLTELAAKCTAKRMVPDYISEKKMLELKVDKNGEGHCYTCMGCRSFLTPYVDPETGKPKYYGRFNQGVVTINLVDVALSSGGNFDKFWKIFDERMAVAHQALQFRIMRCKQATPVNAPTLFRFGAFGRLGANDSVDQLFRNERATVSLGYIGLYEATSVFYGKDWMRDHDWDPEGKEFALSIVKRMNELCKDWSTAEGYHYSVYSTPAESLTDRFNRMDREKFGEVDGVTDHDFYTNSFHYPVWLQPTPMEKLDYEKDFPYYASGGFINYCEFPCLQANPKALEAVWDYAYTIGIGYLGTNTPIDRCYECGFEGDFEPTEEGFKCPECGNSDPDRCNVTKRTCGYLGNPVQRPMVHGRHEEIAHRVKHMSGETGHVTLDDGSEREWFEEAK